MTITDAGEATGEVEETPPCSLDVSHLLEKVVWGTEGARYKLVDIEPTLRHLPNTTYLTLKKDEDLIALRLYIEKQAQWKSQSLHSFYHSFFVVDPAFKGQGYGKTLARATVYRLQEKIKGRGLIYCHVETDNVQSLRISESLGYQRVGRFYAMTFSRFFPSGSDRARKLSQAEVPKMMRLLTEQYEGHALTDFSLSLRPESYYVLAEGNKILAGLQADPQHWKILSLAGTGGAVALHALPRIPLLRDLFNPQRFEFLKIGNVFFEKGRPDAAFELFEAVLAQHQRKTAMMFWDKTSPVFKELATVGSFGLLNALTETPVEVIARFQGFADSEIVDFSRHPKVISPIDI